MIRRYKAWKSWCEYSHMNKFQKILVLLKLKRCTWFEDGWLYKRKEGKYPWQK